MRNKKIKASLKFAVLMLSAMCLLLCLQQIVHAETTQQPKVVLKPKTPGPGDIMVVTIKNGHDPVQGTFRNKPVYFNKTKDSWKAIVGIDLLTEPRTYPLSLVINGKQRTSTVRVVKKKYPLERLTLPEDMVVLSPENEARVEREQKRMAVLWPIDSLRVWSGDFIDPLPGKKIGGRFGVRRIINQIPKSPHSGVDVRADEGDPVLAPNDAVVVLVDDEFYSGNSVVLDHGQGIYTMFFHLSKINVKYGQAVMKGAVIGLVGATGRATGPHLHWGVRMQAARVDPLELIHLKLE
jgi:murein DD-endopeptidase MepM/ murein hydrolase activator NlpD